jgi:hypothetical protein
MKRLLVSGARLRSALNDNQSRFGLHRSPASPPSLAAYNHLADVSALHEVPIPAKMNARADLGAQSQCCMVPNELNSADCIFTS